jgi:ribosomal protein RSM22 (predicted rRNA methylase)
VEHNAGVIDLGQKLLAHASHPALSAAKWTEAGLGSFTPSSRHDLAVFSYSLGELDRTEARALVDRIWKATDWFLLIVEPGTPRGFSLVREMRNHLLGLGGHLIAPCPHQDPCPLQGGDWCHFAARVERTAEHRRLKGATLGFEDEKYSYVAVCRRPLKAALARVTRHPQHFPGFIKLQLCSPEGQRQVAVTKKAKDLFRRARKVRWGDGWPE